jgi:thioester reductase-like protein
MNAERVLISGATGFLGRQIVQVLLERLPEARLALLVRERKGDAAARRLEAVVNQICPAERRRQALERIQVFPADISQQRCGLSEPERLSALDGVTRVIHAAATVRFDHSLKEARRINLGGTANLLELAEQAHRRGSLKSFTYIGTAFVAGRRSGLVREEELEAGQQFRNTYEQSKYEAERLVRARRPGLPVVILRPSVIVGDSRTGITTSFKTIYWPLKIYAQRRWRTVPGFPEAVLDIVPVNFVAEAVAHLALEEGAVGRCAHLCAGPSGCATLGQIAEFASAFFKLPPPRFVNPALFLALLRPILFVALWGPRRRILKDGRFYRPYFRIQATFDTSQAEQLLGPAGIRPPGVMEYLERLFRYCLESDWGSRPGAPHPTACPL